MNPKKTILLDLSEIDNPTCGFGQIHINYSKRFPRVSNDSIQWNFLVPQKFEGTFQDNVEISRFHKKHHKYSRKGLPEVDLWHTTNQQQLKRKTGFHKKYVLTIHDLNYLFEKGWLRRLKHNFILQRAINRADAVTAISQYVADQIRQTFDMKGKEVKVIYNGVEDISEQPTSKPSFVTGRPFFFAIGQIRKKKNFHLLVDMMKYLPEYDLYICGDDHFDFSDVVREHIGRLNPCNSYLCGKISSEEKVWLYRHCEAFLFASMGEGFGLPAIEAMQFGKPVFISSYTCLPEICGGNAFIWPQLNAETMAQVVIEKLPTFSAQMAEKSKEHAAGFSYDKHIQAYMDLYHSVLKK